MRGVYELMSMLLKVNVAFYIDPCTPMLMETTHGVYWLALFKPGVSCLLGSRKIRLL